MEVLDIDKWDRKVPYQNFIKYTNPIFSISSRLDVTQLVNYCKNQSRSYFAEFLYLTTVALNEIEGFKLRIFDDKVVRYEKIYPSYIVMSENKVILTCRTNVCGEHEAFYKAVRDDVEKTKKQTGQNEFSLIANDCFYVTCFPWTDITAMSNPYNLTDKEHSSIPRIAWGKYVKEGDRYKMTVCIEVHHAMIDGEPVCRAFNKIQQLIDEIK